MPQVMLVVRKFMDMMAALTASKLDMLCDSAFICEAVLRSLLPLAKYALQMLYVLAPVTAPAMEGWVREGYAAKSAGSPLISCSNSGSLSKCWISIVKGLFFTIQLLSQFNFNHRTSKPDIFCHPTIKPV
ncbi:hypothetical protein HU200_011038 [Digitaria exilis]|uniref:General transcription factor IIH subunit 4 n=1 Tax=Digitaria exilis TaxID=1010633 RepID=A0A835KR27_9POAL|nr:hypothetical protein HU200_011038 [Digitaria exilis]